MPASAGMTNHDVAFRPRVIANAEKIVTFEA